MSHYLSAHLGPRYRGDAPAPRLQLVQEAARRRILESDATGDWESVDCLCGEPGGRILSDVDRHGLPSRNVLCTRCGLIRISPRWTASRYARFYEHDYRDLYSPLSRDHDDGDLLQELANKPSARQIGEFVRWSWRTFGDPEVSRPTVIEIGTGGGWNLAQVPQSWNRIGYDSDERFLARGREAFGVELRRGFLTEALSSLGEADCVLLSHVVEHIANPESALSTIAAATRPGTLILVEVPGIFRLHRSPPDPMRYWQNAHQYTFCSRTFVETCRRAGLEPLHADEWVRAVLRPTSRSSGLVMPNTATASSIERYLRYCERAHRLMKWSDRVPLVGGTLARLVRHASDVMMRGAIALRFVRGARADSATTGI